MAINTLYRTIDRAAEGIYVKNASRLHCKKGCPDCCIDDAAGKTSRPVHAQGVLNAPRAP